MPVIRYSETSAKGRLFEFVECFWSVAVDPDGEARPSHWVLPDGCSTLSFRLGRNAAFGLRLPSLAPFRAPAVVGERCIGVRFRPGAVARLNHESMSRLAALQFKDPHPSEARGILEEELGRLAGAARDPDPRVDSVTLLMRRSMGTISVNNVANEVNLSERQLERLCLNKLGLGPKAFARTVRLQAVIRRLIADPAANMADIAADFGYSDQAHMGREFIALSAQTPTMYVRSLKGLRLSI